MTTEWNHVKNYHDQLGREMPTLLIINVLARNYDPAVRKKLDKLKDEIAETLALRQSKKRKKKMSELYDKVMVILDEYTE